ncbi:phosphate acyltransferase PlsX [Cylindrospermopsis raciborskii LB2897]|jgi:glycerol-3-phosphate acyltransferase PlsX|uniref:Phosphate acyltransferase n=2 Tax=Cylindrospermopsis raciborskii TaxID=77022 RepID=A0A1X4G5G9_9CYAN|nr:phosphate acyltransferase PlsX [Cylindrospermopsis raciborskii]NLQ06989.1 phosphate acyltransferase PlsX [Cylindrospermopsis raciborskii LB2897]MBG0742604.1 phosphate acyltransferase PlsX [Cylindrospermopsis raciborskii KL1]MCZ2200441.1 phosphate acyltransferase PlsX [Cylindrospermopsis raciborskii PAMP2012]MCZ2205746.1 phosphate acyltransferase PlsX [Cylindrospermopsis raciborskii PAMP2011]NLQ06328.1 phosphate acyltransferase PlsX [Cylindrospermopsis raciborskii MVCC19]
MGTTGVRIAIDAMGGDYAPAEIVAGALRAKEELDVHILLVGDPQQIEAVIPLKSNRLGIEIVPAQDTIGMDEEPLNAVRRKRGASVNVAMDLVKNNQADAIFSAGHSGAAMASALLRLGRLPGIDRPAIGTVFPTIKAGKPVLILDVGANVDCRPKFLEQFAVMGSIYSQYVLGISEPKVGLLNIGEEENKGNEAAVRAHELLRENTQINFSGNAEGRDVLSGEFDVIVCDGFVGNVLLKFAEAVGGVILQILREELPQGIRGQIGTAILKPNLKRVKQRMDHAEHGGALLLGVNGICFIGHGSSQAPSIFSAIRMAKEAVDNQVLERLQSKYEVLQGEPQ